MLKAGIHREAPLDINLDINSERQDCKIGTVCVEEEYLLEGEG
jgi:hypothetical protein